MRSSLAIVCALAATSANAEVGIGVSAKTDSATVYIPVTVERFMFEPFVRATDRDSESAQTTGTIFQTTITQTSEFEGYVVGVGIFRLVPLADRFTLYYGGRLASIDEETESWSVTGTTLPPSQPQLTSTADGHSLMPTLGFHYSIIERLSIGAEIGLEHTDVDVETINRSTTTGAITSTSTGNVTATDTRANVILRFFF
jgi:hypothetical protein